MEKAVVAAFVIAGTIIGIAAAGSDISRGAVAAGLFCLTIGVVFKVGSGMRETDILIYFALGLLFGVFYYVIFFKLVAAGRILPKDNAEAEGIVVSEPALTSHGAVFTLSLLPPYHGDISVFSLDSSIVYGEKLRFKGAIAEGGSMREMPQVTFPKILARESGHGSKFKNVLIAIRSNALKPLRSFIPGENGAFVEGLLLGYKNDFPQSLKIDMKLSGTTHLIALSGYNIGIIVLAIQKLFYGRLPRRVNFWLTTSFIVFFTLLVGAEPSILRAAIMGTMLLAAGELGRLKSFGNAFLWTAFLMLLADPAALFSPGFLLSFLSLAGIVYLAPALLAFVHAPEEGVWRTVLEHIALTLSAELSVMPVIFVIFGTISPVSILANLVVLPLMPLTMLCGFVLLGSGILLPFAAFFVAKMTALFLSFELGAIHLFAHISHLAAFRAVPPVIIAMYYFMLAAFAAYYLRHEEKAAQT